MTDLIVVPKVNEWLRLKSLVLDSVSSPITRRGLPKTATDGITLPFLLMSISTGGDSRSKSQIPPAEIGFSGSAIKTFCVPQFQHRLATPLDRVSDRLSVN